jgi:plastocyanin
MNFRLSGITWPLIISVEILFALSPVRAESAKQNLQFYLPNANDSKIVSVTREGKPEGEVVIVTQAVAVKETGPKDTINTFGEVYSFSPSFIAVHKDQPTELTFWNLQSDDDHDFAVLGHDWKVLLSIDLPPLKKTSYVFTFHREGLFDFKCMQHQPAMSGQILVLPPQH